MQTHGTNGRLVPDGGTGLTGKYSDGAPFRVALAAHGADQTSGVLDIAALPLG